MIAQPSSPLNANQSVHIRALEQDLVQLLAENRRLAAELAIYRTREHPRAQAVLNLLTPKDLLAAGMMMTGRRYKVVAAFLNTTEQVVKNRARSIFVKTGTNNRTQMALVIANSPLLSKAVARAQNGVASDR